MFVPCWPLAGINHTHVPGSGQVREKTSFAHLDKNHLLIVYLRTGKNLGPDAMENNPLKSSQMKEKKS